jgi:biotin carboxyl carrier protein
MGMMTDYNYIEAECYGRVTKILVEDKAEVEYGQPLFIVEKESLGV